MLIAQLTVNIIFRFLVKLDIPPEISADQDVAQLYEQYEELIEQFKAVHKVHSFKKYFEIFQQQFVKECDTIKNSGYSTSELRKDIEEMENEKEIVQKRIERMQRKVSSAMRNEDQVIFNMKILDF